MPSARVVRLAPAEAQSWDALASTQPLGGCFASRAWLGHIERAFGYTAMLLAAEDNGRFLAGAVLLLRRRGPFMISPPAPISLYGGLLLDPAVAAADTREAVALASAVLAEAGKVCHFAHLSVREEPWARAALEQRHWSLRAQETLHVAIADPARARAAYSPSLRRHIRKAGKRGVCRDRDAAVGTVLDLHLRSYERHGSAPPFPRALLERWLGGLVQDGLVDIHCARSAEGAPAAARVVIPFNGTVYDWIAGADLSLGDLSASHWLVDQLVEEYAERGMTTFDFMGANTPGISDFKQLFGGTRVPYIAAVQYRNTMVRVAEALRNTTRRRRGGW